MFKIRIGKPKRRHWYGVTFRREMQARLENGNIPWFMKDTPKIRITKTSAKSPFSRIVKEHEKLLKDLAMNGEGGE